MQAASSIQVMVVEDFQTAKSTSSISKNCLVRIPMKWSKTEAQILVPLARLSLSLLFPKLTPRQEKMLLEQKLKRMNAAPQSPKK
jgi:hypothetical protein